ncbi:hypothetical protein DPMN_096957 [Dreissena polymorpha]|uniref:Uncharacterized protein n=1 Tax=Dreissena polymorpha TaxID=45954 RepID=A0A9D4R5X3_DREPO|nr:hypothetical protein DPMN_096957 [Dreissena polymorpha]
MSDDDRLVNVTGDAEHYFSSNNNSSHTHRETQLSRPRFEHRGNFAPPAIPVVHPSLIRPDNYEGSGDFEAYMSHFRTVQSSLDGMINPNVLSWPAAYVALQGHST